MTHKGSKKKLTVAAALATAALVLVAGLLVRQHFRPRLAGLPAGALLPSISSVADEIDRYLLVGFISTIGISIILAGLIARRRIAPYEAIMNHLEELPGKEGGERLLDLRSRGRAGKLAEGINRMVAELDRQQAALQRSEELYRTVADFATEISFWRSAEGRLRYISPCCERLTGYPDRDFYQDHGLLDRIIVPDDAAAWEAYCREAREEGGTPLELRLITRDGAPRWFRYVSRPVEENGTFRGVRGSFTDINELKEAGARQANQLRFLETLIETIPSPVFFKDAVGIYVGCNSAFLAYLGVERDAIVGKRVYDIAPPELAEVYEAADRALFRDGGIQVYEAAVRSADGAVQDVVFYKATFSHVDGSLGGLIGIILDITERKSAERALRESEAKFRILFEESRDAIVVTNAAWRVVHANRSAGELFGWPEFESAGPSLREAFCDEAVAASMMKELASTGYVRDIEMRVKGAAGGRLVTLFSASIRRGGDGGTVGYQCILHDITDRKGAEEALQKNNVYLAALHEITLGLVARLELRGLLQAILQRAATLMNTRHGYLYLLAPDGASLVLHGRSGIFTEWAEETVSRESAGLVADVWRKGEALAVEGLPVPIGDGTCAMAGIPLKSDARVAGVFGLAFVEEGTCFGGEEIEILERFAQLASLALENARLYEESRQELQERKRAEEELRKLSHAVEQSPVSVFITDPEGVIEYVNPRFTALTGYTAAEVAGKTPRILKSGETPPGLYENLWRTVRGGDPWQGEFHNRKKDGDLFWVLAYISPIRDLSGMITHFIAVQEDITERKSLEGKLVHSQKMKAVGQLAGGIAHDFNNILTAIIGFATYLQLKTRGEPQVRNAVEQILAAADRGAGLVKALLAFSRNQQTNPKPVLINDIVRRMSKLLERLIGEDIVLAVELSEANPVVVADSLQIEQVLMNLTTNAHDAMLKGGNLTISTSVTRMDGRFIARQGFGRPGNYAEVTVADTGEGIDEEAAKQIFEPFFTTKETGKGTGLGLSIAYGIIKKHRGYISCTSVKGKGTTFSLYLPMIDSAVEAVGKATPEAVTGGRETILLAEDDRVVRTVEKDILEEFGYTVIEAVDGVEAVEKFQERGDDVDLLLLDLVMPRKTGREAFEEIRRMRPEIPVIFTSGYSPEVIERKGLLEPGVGYLEKSLSPQELLKKIREVLKK